MVEDEYRIVEETYWSAVPAQGRVPGGLFIQAAKLTDGTFMVEQDGRYHGTVLTTRETLGSFGVIAQPVAEPDPTEEDAWDLKRVWYGVTGYGSVLYDCFQSLSGAQAAVEARFKLALEKEVNLPGHLSPWDYDPRYRHNPTLLWTRFSHVHQHVLLDRPYYVQRASVTGFRNDTGIVSPITPEGTVWYRTRSMPPDSQSIALRVPYRCVVGAEWETGEVQVCGRSIRYATKSWQAQPVKGEAVAFDGPVEALMCSTVAMLEAALAPLAQATNRIRDEAARRLIEGG